jgi:hypothetical protein
MIGCNISVAFYTPNAGGNANRASTLAKMKLLRRGHATPYFSGS